MEVVLKVFSGAGSALAATGTAAELCSLETASFAEVRFGVELAGIASTDIAVVEGAGRSIAGAGFSDFVDWAVCTLADFDGRAESP